MRLLLLTLAVTCVSASPVWRRTSPLPPQMPWLRYAAHAPETAISPNIPEAARQDGITGKVLVRISISGEGMRPALRSLKAFARIWIRRRSKR